MSPDSAFPDSSSPDLQRQVPPVNDEYVVLPASELALSEVERGIPPRAVPRALPDLSSKLQEYGLLEEYQRQRHGYMKWRMWWNDRSIVVTGAKGDITNAEALLKKEQHATEFKGWYKDFASWKWQRTCSYWVAVTFLIGALLFALCSFAGCFPYLNEPPFNMINARLVYAANLYFTVGQYFMMLSVTNFNRHGVDVSDMLYNPFAYWAIKERIKKQGLHMNSYHIAFNYMIGVIFYNSYTALAVMTFDKPDWVVFWFGTVASMLGGFFFWTGGVLEMKENEVWPFKHQHVAGEEEQSARGIGSGQKSIPKLAKYTAVMNQVGGFLFFCPGFADWADAYALLLVSAEDGVFYNALMWGVGSLLYVLGSSLSILMWKNNQLGLVYMANLNTGVRGGGGEFSDDGDEDDDAETSSPSGPTSPRPDTASSSRQKSSSVGPSSAVARKSKKKLSIRTVLMVFCCSFFSAVALTDFFMAAMVADFHDVDSVITWFHDCFPFLLYSLTLVAMSAVPHLPNDQPFRFLMLSMRWLCFILGLDVMYHAAGTYKSLMKISQVIT